MKSDTQTTPEGWDRPHLLQITSSEEKSTISVREPTPIPIDILPIDVLRDIFIACVSLELTTSRNRDVLRISQVSSLWRQTAIETSALWSSLAISTPHFPPNVKSAERGAILFWASVESWLERSGVCDLSLSIQRNESSTDDMDSGCVECIKLVEIVLIPYAQRICYLRGLRPQMLKGLSQPLRSLRSIALDPDLLFPPSSFPILRRLAPNLRELEFHSMKRGILANPENHLYLNQITHLIAGVGSYRTWTQIVENLSNLETIVLHVQKEFCGNHMFEDISLPKLSTLTIVLLSPIPLNLCLFRNLKMPALQTFRLQPHSQMQFDCFSTGTNLHRDFERISGIKRLSLICSPVAAQSVLFFAGLPDLEELDIQDCPDYEDLFACLNDHRQQWQNGLVNSSTYPPVLTHLRTLTLDIRQFELRNPQFVEFIGAQLVLEPFFRVIVYITGRERAMARIAKEVNLPIEFIVWDEIFGSRRDRWKYRMESEGTLGKCAYWIAE